MPKYLLKTCLFLLFFTTSLTHAHNFGEGGHLIITLNNSDTPEMQFDLTTGEINKRYILDTNQDGKVDYAEEEHYPATALQTYIKERLSISFDNKPCQYDIINHRLMLHGNGNYVRFLLEHHCPRPVFTIGASYHLLFDEDPEHRGSMHLTRGDAMIQMRFFDDQRQQSITLKDISITQTLIDFIGEGIWHIWIGLDHVLFLICLLLPAAYRLNNQQWQARDSFKDMLFDSLKVVTAFTLAHSITLVSAVMAWVELPPPRLTESVIALSVLVVALNCIFPKFEKSLWGLTFVFGLIHGFGFANALLALSLPPTATTIALVAFNIGVELGQVLIVIALLPCLYKARKWVLYRCYILPMTASATILIALIWLIERAANIDLISIV